MHTGYGIVHNIEKELGVTKNGHDFSYLVNNDYKDGKKFEWENAEQVMENVIRNSSVNKTPEKQKDVREKGNESKPRKEQFFNAKKYKVNVPSVVKSIGDRLWKVTKTVGPLAGVIIVTAMIEQHNKEYDEEYDEEYTSTADGTGNRSHASPREHDVKGHGQHYNTREGRIWIEKETKINKIKLYKTILKRGVLIRKTHLFAY